MSTTEANERIDKILEDYLQANWALADPAAEEIAWGYKGTQLLNSAKAITLRCYPLFTTVTHPEISRLAITATVRIDVFAQDRSAANKGRSTKLTALHKYLESFFSNRSNIIGFQDKGIHWVKPADYNYIDDPEYNDIFHLVFDVEMRISRPIV